MQIELHRHLEASIRLSTLLEYAQAEGFETQSTSLEAFREKVVLRKPVNSLHEFLARFDLLQKVLTRPEYITRMTTEALEDCAQEGTQGVEFRYSPSFLSERSHLDWKIVLEAIEKGIHEGLQRLPSMKTGLICIASRDYGEEGVDQTVEFFLRHQSSFIGLDLAGNEDQFPCRLFTRSFKKAIQAQAKITIHAGEASGPENMWEAIDLLGAQRIGHGIACIQDLQLIEHLKQKQICLEVCPTSNFLTQTVKTLEYHPIREILRHGVSTSINTDDPLFCGIGLDTELNLCKNHLQLTSEDLMECENYAKKASFIRDL